MLEKLKKSSFDPHMKSKFTIHPEGMEAVDIELVESTEKNTEVVENFSLIFRGPKDNPFSQGMHKIKHAKMGEFGLFLVPIIHEKQDGTYYQAVFNRLIETDD